MTIQTYLQISGLSQAEVARRARRSEAAISKMVQLDRPSSLPLAIDIWGATGGAVSPDYQILRPDAAEQWKAIRGFMGKPPTVSRKDVRAAILD
jgi:hypothetical protein